MALEKNVALTAFGNHTVNGAYISVDSCRVSKVVDAEGVPARWVVMTTMRVDFSAQSKADGSAPLGTFGAEFAYQDGTDPIAATYEYLKTLPEFADAIDC